MAPSLLLWACKPSSPQHYQAEVSNPEFFHQSVQKLTDVIVHDIFSPPVASRVYAYPSIAAYEVMAAGKPEYQSLAGQLKGLKPIPQPQKDQTYCYELASIHAFLIVGRTLVFSEASIEAFEQEIYQKLKDQGIPRAVYNRSIEYGAQVAEHIQAWMNEDNYKETRTFPKYTVRDEVAAWKPTPPSYMEGIEPHWNKIRPFVLDSASQFVPPPPTAFDMEEGSQFYQELMEVYKTGVNLSDEQLAIAQFWDCNPYVSHQKGHAMFATKKITPGGHWIGITAIACREAKADFAKVTEAYALVSIALMDAFISCWDEKWRSVLVRPETLINQFIDEDWAPLLQTPPFPEHTSGHSVISRAAAVTLTDLFGDNFHFKDTTENAYGLPTRTYDSFVQAADEAAISRLYGGIHYRPACELGIAQGQKVGKLVLDRVKTKQEDYAKRKETGKAVSQRHE